MGFQLDAILYPGLEEARNSALLFERIGYHGVFSTDTSSDPFMDLVLPAFETTRPLLGTHLAIAFPRSPFVTALSAWQLHRASGGRFVLGLGTQVRHQIEKRFGMRWESPGPKMREYVEAVRAIWEAFQTGRPPDFRGRFYTHTDMLDFFNPGPLEHSPPEIWVAAVGTYNAETVGRVGDGLLVHPLHTVPYVQEVLLPAVDRGLASSGRTRGDVIVMNPVLLALGRDERERAASAAWVKTRMAFYASGRNTWPVFEHHGWEETPRRIERRLAEGDLTGIGEEITDEMLEAIAIVGHPDEAADRIRRRYADVAERLYLYRVADSPYTSEEGYLRELVAALS